MANKNKNKLWGLPSILKWEAGRPAISNLQQSLMYQLTGILQLLWTTQIRKYEVVFEKASDSKKVINPVNQILTPSDWSSSIWKIKLIDDSSNTLNAYWYN